MIIVTVLSVALRLSEKNLAKSTVILLGVPLALMQVVAGFLAGSIISGVTAIIVTQLAVTPMKPVRLRTAFQILRKRLKPFLKTAVGVTLRIILGWICLLVPGLIMTARFLLWAPVVLMEGLEKKEARKRSRQLASRSWRTIIVVMLVQFLVPAIVGGVVGSIMGVHSPEESHAVRVKITGQAASLLNIFVLPLASIVPALVYLKMRQFGGETLNDVMAQLEDLEGNKSGWRQRMRSRLTVTPQSRTPTY